ncbi:MAG: copper resistance CopC family protein [Candidatus Nanopelagicales bacterium]
MNTYVRKISRALIGIGAMGAVLLITAPAQAHGQLVSSTPTNGAVLDAAPASVAFTFDEPLLPELDTISINTDTGKNLVSARVEPVGDTLTMQWPTDIAPGTYQVAYRIVSEDGHPVTGAITFTFGTPQPTATTFAEAVDNVQEGPPLTTIATIGAIVLLLLSVSLIVVLVRRGNGK